MEQEKIESIKKRKLENLFRTGSKIKEIKEEEKFERERKKELQKFIRLEIKQKFPNHQVIGEEFGYNKLG